MKGRKTQKRKTKTPAKKIKSSAKKPKRMRNILKTAPITLDIILKVNTFRYFLKPNPPL